MAFTAVARPNGRTYIRQNAMLQHRLAKFYLRGFTQRPGPRVLFEYEKSQGFRREIKPKFASTELDTFEVEGFEPREVEQFFGRVEGFAKQTFDTLRNRKDPTSLEREYLAVFMGLCFLRSSKRGAENDEFSTRLLDVSQVAEYCRSPATKIRYMLRHRQLTAAQYDEQAEDYIRRLRAGQVELPRPPRGSELSLLQRACTKWARCLEAADWSVEVAEGTDYFIVPDEPLVARRRGYPFDPTYVGISRGDLAVEITFPLNRRMCLVMRHSAASKSVGFHAANSARIDEINLRSIVCAHKLIFSPVRSSAIESLIATVGTKEVTVPKPANLCAFLNDIA
jgi:hypothetical protein